MQGERGAAVRLFVRRLSCIGTAYFLGAELKSVFYGNAALMIFWLLEQILSRLEEHQS